MQAEISHFVLIAAALCAVFLSLPTLLGSKSRALDRYKRMALPELVERVSDIPGVEWIRLHYGYPSHFPYDLLPVMRERDNVCKYMDIALQHISNPMLEKPQYHEGRDV